MRGVVVSTKRTFSDIPTIVDEVAAGGSYTAYWASYTGRHFDGLVRGSDPFRFTAIDMVALNMLSVSLDPQGIATLLFDARVADEASRLLRLIPDCTPLHCVTADEVGSDSAAAELWALLRAEVRGVGSGLTVISKLMAAKRPHLFPIWDSRIDDVIELPDGQLWEPMRNLVADDESRRTIEAATSGFSDRATLLRRIDTALWLYGDHRVKSSRVATK
jgi:Family of unknown function (DUF6308)